MEKYFSKDEYENDSPYMSGFTRKGKQPNGFRAKSAKETFDPFEEVRNVYQKKFTEDMLNNIRKQYLTVKLRRMMAFELLKNRIGGNLKRVVEQINEQASHGSLGKGKCNKDFLILGGGPQSLSYSTRKKTANTPNRIKPFTIEVDVRGYIPDNVMIDTKDKRMSIRAVRVSGNKAEKVLGIIAPSISDLNKLKIHHPKGGLLVIQYYPGPVNAGLSAKLDDI